MKNKKQSIERRHEWFTIYPSLSKDKLNGKDIKSGVMFMQMHAADCEVKHKGKKHSIRIGYQVGGAAVILMEKRYAKLNIQKFLDEAIKSGLLDDVIDFTDADVHTK